MVAGVVGWRRTYGAGHCKHTQLLIKHQRECRKLIEKGNLSKPLIVQNRTKARAEAFTASCGDSKVVAADSVEDAVKRADIIFTCVGQQSTPGRLAEAS